MPCEHYKDALIEAAAAGPQGELRAHLDECASCRTAFAEEQSLFAAIDSGLHATVNAGVPVSLLPRVRARLDEAVAPQSRWVSDWLVLVSATAVVIVAFFAARTVWQTNVDHKRVETTARTNVRPPASPSQKPSRVVEPPVEKDHDPRRQFAIAANSLARETAVHGKTEPEVLVPRDQEVLLAEYAAEWSLHKRTPLVPQDSDATIMAQLQVAPIQIDELGVKLLAEEKQQ
jgi:hypothetical protein